LSAEVGTPARNGVEIELEIVMATSNEHKLEEANYVLREFGIVLVGRDLKGDEIQSIDTALVAKSSLEAALLKSTSALVVEDTGLFIGSLNGFPGTYASPTFNTIGTKGILKLLSGITDRSAYFDAAVAYGVPPDKVWVFTGRVHGRISAKEAGGGGFGFDPIFIPEGFNRTFAEMSLEEKSAVSHRALAFRRLGAWLTHHL
jgi:XTP/dITP diphosphohydrolase